MPEQLKQDADIHMKIRHRGRLGQIPIYLGKQFRMFVYQSDWKVLPMSALIAGLVGMVIRTRMFINMEGCLMGSFALACVGIWNGCFNSIQVICRERDVIKRGHRSGMHISSYVFSHMVYQAVICLLQTVITVYITNLVGVQYPEAGLFTKWFHVDFGISMFLITYASDMLSLWISSMSKSSTSAMTIMPFVLIFQLVFSGGMLTLPEWSEPFTYMTISNPGLKVIAAQSDYNNRPMSALWNQIVKMKNLEINRTVRIGDVIEELEHSKNSRIEEMRSAEVADGITAGELIDAILKSDDLEALKDRTVTINTTVEELIDLIGEDRVKDLTQNKIASVSYNADYEYSEENILFYWFRLLMFALGFAALATITLEFIDRDKR